MSLDKWSIQNYKSKDVEVLVFSKYNAAKKMYFQNEVEEFTDRFQFVPFRIYTTVILVERHSNRLDFKLF